MRVKSEQKRQEILDIAAEMFEAKGFEAASMSAIASRVGGSKGTLYNYFASKEELFIEVMFALAQRHKKQLEQCGYDEGGIEAALREFGKAYLAFITQPWVLEMYRTILGFKQADGMRRDFYEKGPCKGRQKLAGFMRRAMEVGQLARGDAELMGAQYKALLEAEGLQLLLLDVIGKPSAKQLEAWVAHAVDAFMAIYGPAKRGRK